MLFLCSSLLRRIFGASGLIALARFNSLYDGAYQSITDSDFELSVRYEYLGYFRFKFGLGINQSCGSIIGCRAFLISPWVPVRYGGLYKMGRRSQT